MILHLYRTGKNEVRRSGIEQETMTIQLFFGLCFGLCIIFTWLFVIMLHVYNNSET